MNILSVFHELSDGEYFAEPYKWDWCPERKMGGSQIPKWFQNKKYVSIGNIAMCILERIISLKYIYYHTRDKELPIPEYENEINKMMEYWRNLDSTQKETIYCNFVKNMESVDKNPIVCINWNVKQFSKIKMSCLNNPAFPSYIVLIPAKHIRMSYHMYSIFLATI